MDTEVWKRAPIPLKKLSGNRDADLGFSLTKTREMMESLLLGNYEKQSLIFSDVWDKLKFCTKEKILTNSNVKVGE